MGYSNMLIDIYTAAGTIIGATTNSSEHLKSINVPQDACLYATANGVMCQVKDTKYLVYKYDRPHMVWGLGLSELSKDSNEIYIERNFRNGAPEYSIGEVINLSTLNQGISTNWNGKLFLYELTPITGKWTIDWTKLQASSVWFGWGDKSTYKGNDYVYSNDQEYEYFSRNTRSQNVNFNLCHFINGTISDSSNYYGLQTYYTGTDNNNFPTTSLFAMGKSSDGIVRYPLAKCVGTGSITVLTSYNCIDFGTEEQLVSLEFYQWLSTFATPVSPRYTIKLYSQDRPEGQLVLTQLASTKTHAGTARLFVYRDKITDAYGRIIYENKTRGADIMGIAASITAKEPTYTWIDGFKAAVTGIPSIDIEKQNIRGYHYIDPSTLSIGDVYVDKTAGIAYAAVQPADGYWIFVESEACGYSIDTASQTDSYNEIGIYIVMREIPIYYTIRSTTLKRIANAIRSKTENPQSIRVDRFADEILSIPTYNIESDKLNSMLDEVFGE